MAAEEDDDDGPSTVTTPSALPPVRSSMAGLRLASSRPSDPGTDDGSTSFLATARITSVSPAVLVPTPADEPPASAPTQKVVTAPPRRPVRTTLVRVPGAPAKGPTWREGAASRGARPLVGSQRAGGGIDLIWADPAAASKIRRAFGDHLAGLPPAAEADHEAAVVRVLSSGEPRDAAALDAAMASAIRPDGGFRPPVVLVAGELSFAFDGIETLRAVVRAARPFASGDAALEEEIDAAAALLAKPGIVAASEQAERLARRARGAFAPEVEQILLARRAYDRRALLGGDRIRARITWPGVEAACPVYLPGALAKALPMFSAFEARVIAEVHGAQEASEGHPIALDALAIGRVVPAA